MERIPHIEELTGLLGDFSDRPMPERNQRPLREREQRRDNLVPSLEEAVRLSGLKDGMTVSFHHHFRNGDYVVNMVMQTLARMGFKDLVVAASSLTDCHEPLIELVKNGVIRRFETSGLRGKLATAVSRGLMDFPVVFRSHGGRAHAIETGALPIDVAFLGAPSCDAMGNVNGYSREGEGGVMCGSMGYARCDAQCARKTVVLTNNLVPYPNAPFGIPESDVDYIVEVPEIGNPAGIMSGATRFTSNPKELLIAEAAAKVIQRSGYLKDGFSMQMGSGGASLAVARYLRNMMLEDKITASFFLGGITGTVVDLHEEGLVRRILDVQSFDTKAASSLKNNRFHQQISASYYASPGNVGAAVNQLDVVVLSAMEIDRDFNVNVLTGADGVIRGAIGGHQDTAFGAALTVVVCPLTRGRIACVTDKVHTLVTPGSCVDVLVTERGVAVNPRRPEILERLRNSSLRLRSMDELLDLGKRILGASDPIPCTDQVVGVVTYRDGSVLDVIRAIQ